MKFYKTIFFVLISFILIGCQSKSNEDLVNRTIIEPETKQEKKSETKEVKIKSTDNYLEITQNPISETFEDLLDYDIEKEMGDLGK